MGTRTFLHSGYDVQDMGDWTYVGDDVWMLEETTYCDIPPHQDGAKLFDSAGGSSSGSELYRDLDISSLSTDIAAGNATFDANAWQSVYSPDESQLAIEFYDVGDSIIGTRVATTAASDHCTWTKYPLSGSVPTNAVTARVILVAIKVGGGSNVDTHFDDVEFSITSPAAQEDDSLTSGVHLDAVVTPVSVDSEVSSFQVDIVSAGTLLDARIGSVQVDAVVLRVSGPAVINHNPITSFMMFG